MLWKRVLWRMVWGKDELRKKLSTLRFLQSLQPQHSALNGARTGLQVANRGAFSRDTLSRIWKKIRTCGIRRAKPSSRSNSVLPPKRSNRKWGKVKKKKNNKKKDKIEKIENEAEELAEPVPE